ncbi:hypothetical protein ACJW31_11G189000 [Castanea mollissima]
MSLILLFLILLSISLSWATSFSYPTPQTFIQCMSTQFSPYTKFVGTIYTSNSSLYLHLLQSSQQNPRWLNFSTPKPLLIITPFQESEIQATILCSKKYNLQIRVRSGGHDYEGLSYLCKTPFILVDLFNLRSVEINLEDETAWVQTGATLGELCPSVGVGGHFSGGSLCTLLRKYGLAADNVLDAYLIEANGKIMDRETMGEDLFWAIRGGGGASFGVILSWKIKLVRVPPTVTTFNIKKTLAQGATKLVSKWQYISDKLHEDLFIRFIIQNVGNGTQKTVQASFNSLFLGVDRLMPLMNESFPELGLQAENCTKMNWIQSILFLNGFQTSDPMEVLLDRKTIYKDFLKAKSDFVKEPISDIGLEGIWKRFLKEERVFMIMDPYGVQMKEISESNIPFPHRKGNLYNIQYLVWWEVNGIKASNKHVHWIRMLCKYMRPYVSNNVSYLEARVWGLKYFKGNFKRFAQVKSKVDPKNFFRNKRSIPFLESGAD